MAATLTVRDLGKTYPAAGDRPAVTVLDGVSLDVAAGSIVSVVGLNGSGKTTLLRIIAGLEPPSQGSILIDGRPPVPGGSGGIGLVGQDVALLPWRTVRDNIALGLELQRLPTARRFELARQYEDAFGLADWADRYPKELSGGMRQKAAIARTLVASPGVVLMDEPFSALDCQTRNRMQAFLLDVWATRRDTILFVTHNIEEAVLVSDHIIVLTPKPSRVEEILAVDLPRPRLRTDAAVNALRSNIFETLGKLLRQER
ncbi:MAG: ABC transporter ATP-binding protein [Solidesulfovibrio sp.]|uniref:ABC transporter ATP-binding protein n=1 Tax=Solidesulfovibrio sp. TaxID=2910990 RepID=UPI002B20F0B2|nr:ABC transporter ATP-binding protein [Solidesulfovibrio sp.]MEA4857126.1 ABC transporter ATP-binding protein [Solidesulfovibrio sp.]